MKIEVNKDLALLYGIMLGDGCIGKYKRKDRKNGFHYRVCITCNALDDKPFFGKVVGPLLKKFTNREIKYRKRDNRIDFNFSNKELFHQLKSLGFPVGKKGQNLIIPKLFFNDSLSRYIIQGFFATDGCLTLTKNPNKYYPRVESQAICKKLLKEIHFYLVKLGMRGHYYDCGVRPDLRFKVVQRKYKFQFNGKENLLLFNNLIGFINPKHNKRFLKFLEYDKEYIKLMKNIPSQKQKEIRENFHSNFNLK